MKAIKFIITVVTFLIFSSLATATDFQIFVEPIQNEISIEESATYKIYIKSFQETDDIITLYFNDPSWEIHSQPLYHYFSGIKIAPNETIESIIYLDPTKSIGIGRYKIGVDAVSQNTEAKISKTLNIEVKPYFQQIKNYIPQVDITTSIPESFDPRETGTFKIHFKNKNPLNITNLTIQIEGDLFSEYRETTLPPLVTKSEEFEISFDNLIEPTKDKLLITVKTNHTILGVIQKSYDTTGYSAIEQDYYQNKTFFMKVQKITLSNTGNVPNQKSITVPTTKFNSFFQKTTPEGTEIQKLEGLFYKWDITLQPQETKEIVLITNHRPMFIPVIVFIIAIIIYFLSRPKIVVTKTGTTVTEKEGGASEVKILIIIKNRSGSLLQNLQIIDRIPKLVDISTEQTLGTLAPSKVLKHEKRGTLLKWNIETLEGYEERILSYKITAKLSILGHFRLPAILVKYQNKKGSQRMVSSEKTKV